MNGLPKTQYVRSGDIFIAYQVIGSGPIDLVYAGPVGIEIWAPSLIDDEYHRQWRSNFLRLAAGPGEALAILRMNMEIDVRHVLPAIRVPTLILHRTGDRLTPVAQARHMAEGILGAKLVQIPGADHSPYVGDSDAIAAEIEEDWRS
jgi:pimeloyl-ACP methyl ester carboxylesterase